VLLENLQLTIEVQMFSIFTLINYPNESDKVSVDNLLIEKQQIKNSSYNVSNFNKLMLTFNISSKKLFQLERMSIKNKIKNYIKLP